MKTRFAHKIVSILLVLFVLFNALFVPFTPGGVSVAEAGDGMAQLKVVMKYPAVKVEVMGTNQYVDLDKSFAHEVLTFTDNPTMEATTDNWWWRFSWQWYCKPWEWCNISSWWTGEKPPEDSGPLVWVTYENGFFEAKSCKAPDITPDITKSTDWVTCEMTYEGPGTGTGGGGGGGGGSGGGASTPIEIIGEPTCSASSVAAIVSWNTNIPSKKTSVRLAAQVGDKYQTETYPVGFEITSYQTPDELYPGVTYSGKVFVESAVPDGISPSFDEAQFTCKTKPGKLKVELLDLKRAQNGEYKPINPKFNFPGYTTSHWKMKTSNWGDSEWPFGVGSTLVAQVGVTAQVDTSFSDEPKLASVNSYSYIPSIEYGISVNSGGFYQNINNKDVVTRTGNIIKRVDGVQIEGYVYYLTVSENGITDFSYVPPFALKEMSDTITVWATGASAPIINPETNNKEYKYLDGNLEISTSANLVMQGCFVVGGPAEHAPPATLQSNAERGCNNEQITDEYYRSLRDDEGLYELLKTNGEIQQAQEETAQNIIGLIPGFGEIGTLIDVVQNVMGIYQLHNSIQDWARTGPSAFPGEGRAIQFFNAEELHVVTYQVYSMSGVIKDRSNLTNELFEYQEGLSTPRLYYVVYTIRDVGDVTGRTKIYQGVVAGPPQWLIQAAEDWPREPYCYKCNELYGSIDDVYQDVKEYRELYTSNSPIHYWIELPDHKRIGTLGDGTLVNDGIPGEYYTFPESDGTISEVVMLPLGEHVLNIVGTKDNATFSLAISQNRENNQIVGLNYADVPINSGQNLSVTISPSDYPIDF